MTISYWNTVFSLVLFFSLSIVRLLLFITSFPCFFFLPCLYLLCFKNIFFRLLLLFIVLLFKKKKRIKEKKKQEENLYLFIKHLGNYIVQDMISSIRQAKLEEDLWKLLIFIINPINLFSILYQSIEHSLGIIFI